MSKLNRVIDLIDGFIAADSLEDRWALARKTASEPLGEATHEQAKGMPALVFK